MKSQRKGLVFISCIVLTLTFFLSGISVFAAEGNTWNTRASMFTVRYNHEVVELNGKIYAIGGHNGTTIEKSVEEYDPITNSWTTKSPMNNARTTFQLAVVNEKIYAIGGYESSGKVLNTVEEYDPAKNKWTVKAPMQFARAYHQVAVVDGKIYVIGGYDTNNPINSVEEFDPEANVWVSKANMPTARYIHRIAVANKKIYAIGGNGGGSYLNSVEEFNPATNTWSTMAKMTGARQYHELVVLNNKIYAIGGATTKPLSTVEAFDLSTYTWSTKAPLKNSKTNHQIAVINGKIYAIGGSTEANTTNLVEVYNPITDTWQSVKEMTYPRCHHRTAVLDGKIYAIGGIFSPTSLNSVEEYTPEFTAPTATTLTASSGNGKVVLSWNSVPDATSYNIKRAEAAGGTYTTIATSSAITFTDTNVKNGTSYYYIVTAVNNVGEGINSNEVTGLPTNDKLNIEITSIDKALMGDEITANIIIHNAVNICAEDLKIAFDPSKLEFISCEVSEGIKIFKEDNSIEGIIRYITASLGKSNAANGDKLLLKLTFKAKAPGTAKISIANARVADNSTLEKDLESENCGEKTVFIQAAKDINRTGEFTLLDLAIDAWYYQEIAENTDISKYDADVVVNGIIDDDDLTEIVNQILKNSNYPLN